MRLRTYSSLRVASELMTVSHGVAYLSPNPRRYHKTVSSLILIVLLPFISVNSSAICLSSLYASLSFFDWSQVQLAILINFNAFLVLNASMNVFFKYSHFCPAFGWIFTSKIVNDDSPFSIIMSAFKSTQYQWCFRDSIWAYSSLPTLA